MPAAGHNRRARYTGEVQTTASISNFKTTALEWNRQASLTQTPTTWAQQPVVRPMATHAWLVSERFMLRQIAAAVGVVYEPETSGWAAT